MKPFAKLRELLEKSTPGEWNWVIQNDGEHVLLGNSDLDKEYGAISENKIIDEGSAGREYSPQIQADEPNAQFIAEAHNQLPKLLEALDDAVAELEELQFAIVTRQDTNPADTIIFRSKALAKIKALGDE